jgi:L-lactate dehydrogenase complex protein LldG
MSAKNKIIESIRQNIPDEHALPEMPSFPYPSQLLQHFRESIEGVGGTAVETMSLSEIGNYLQTEFPEAKTITTLPGLQVFLEHSQDHIEEAELAGVDLAILPGGVGVAENGAVWVKESDIVHRALPFITQHLALVVHEDQLVGNMHDAYQQIHYQTMGFGVFISGPSKTADIEQSMVIGAHGARSLHVFIICS